MEEIRSALQREFISRCKKNPSYSLRAFAKYLEIDQSFLSRVLRGQRSITESFAQSVAGKLGIKIHQIQSLVGAGATPTPGFLNLTDDEFELMSEWQHFAIIELSKTEHFEFDPPKIAHRLGLHVQEVRDAIERLERLHFIQIKNQKIKILSPNTSWINNKKTSDARKRFQKSLLEKSIYAIEHCPFEERQNASLTVAIAKERLPEFKEKINKIQQELADFFQGENEKNLNEVYQLTIAFFPLTK